MCLEKLLCMVLISDQLYLNIQIISNKHTLIVYIGNHSTVNKNKIHLLKLTHSLIGLEIQLDSLIQIDNNQLEIYLL